MIPMKWNSLLTRNKTHHERNGKHTRKYSRHGHYSYWQSVSQEYNSYVLIDSKFRDVTKAEKNWLWYNRDSRTRTRSTIPNITGTIKVSKRSRVDRRAIVWTRNAANYRRDEWSVHEQVRTKKTVHHRRSIPHYRCSHYNRVCEGDCQ